jgi:cell division protein FtsW
VTTTAHRTTPHVAGVPHAPAPPRRVRWRDTVQRTLERPLACYYLLLGSVGLLLTLGLVMVLSSSSVDGFRTYGNSYYYFLRQLTWVVLAAPFVWAAVRLPRRALRALTWPGMAVAVVLLALTQYMGVEVDGNKNWLALGPIRIQPSELAKLAAVLWCAHVFATKERLLGDWRHTLVPVLPVMALVVGLVVLGQDLGTALVLLAIVLGMLWVVGAPAKLFIGSFLVATVAAFTLAASSPVRMERLTSFVDPFKTFEGAGWQAAHGIFAMSSGGLLGKGIGASQQKWGTLPAAHTDFIFAVLGEELGLVGTLLVLGLFLTLAYAGFRVARQAQEPFVRYVAAGVTIWFTAQMVINVGMVLALLPVIGLPLPLVSYGGSALLPSLIAMGLLISLAREQAVEAGAAPPGRGRRQVAGVVARGLSARRRSARARRGR